MFKIDRFLLITLLALSISACQTMTSRQDWPSDVPARNIFVKAFYKKRNLKKVEDRVMNDHLNWILRFYQGTIIYPNGWNRVSTLFLDSMASDTERKKMEKRLTRLGIRIATEWAQDNQDRNINSRNMVTWASALRTAAERDDHSSFISKVEADVEALIAREIAASDIDYERYYPEEDYDDF